TWRPSASRFRTSATLISGCHRGEPSTSAAIANTSAIGASISAVAEPSIVPTQAVNTLRPCRVDPDGYPLTSARDDRFIRVVGAPRGGSLMKPARRVDNNVD